MLGRLRTKIDFDRVFALGQSVSSGQVFLRLYARGDESPTRVGWVIGKKVGGAVQRNRMRRRLRGLLMESQLRPGFDCVVVIRNQVGPELESGLKAVLEDSGLMEERIETGG